MPIERSADHPTFELGGNAITSYAAAARGSEEITLYRAEVPPGGGLAMLPGTKLIRDDGSELVPDWVR